jgi:hypothetical protein
MEATNFSRFHELAEQLKGQVTLKELCGQEGVNYKAYASWRTREGISPRVKRRKIPKGMVELEPVGLPPVPESIPKTTSVHIEFENGLKLDRTEMEVDHLIEFLTKIRGALCLG